MVALLTLNILLSGMARPVSAGPIGPGLSSLGLQHLSETPAVLNIGRYSTINNVRLQNNGMLTLNREAVVAPVWSGNWADFGLFSAQPQRLEMPFNTLRATWTAEVPEGTRLEVDLRVSPDAVNWTFWQILEQSGQLADFGAENAFLYAQYRIRLFSNQVGNSPLFKDIQLEANQRDLNGVATARLFALSAADDKAKPAPPPPPTYNVHATREGLVGGRTANGHIIQPRDRFVSLPSWTALNDKDKWDYKVRIVTSKGTSAIAPVWDVGPWNFKDNYWHNPRFEFKDLPIGVPQAEKAFYEKHNKGLNESGAGIYNPSGIDIADGTYWDELGQKGAWDGKVDVTFLWEGALPGAATTSDVTAVGAWHNGVVVKWNTSLATSSWVEYGLTQNFGQTSWVDAKMVSAHQVVLTDLVPGQTYHFRVRGKDIYGTETASPVSTFKTLPGLTVPLAGFQKDVGIGLKVAKDNTGLTLLGGRVNPGYWNDNPIEDYTAGASISPNSFTLSGNLDFDIAPTCDDKGQNCLMGYGSGYKYFVRLSNQKGDMLEFGLIHDVSGLSPHSMTLMIEGKVGGKLIRQYNPPDSGDQKLPHHFHFFWWEGKLLLIYNHGQPQVFNFKADDLNISFIGAGRAKGDILAASFQNIAFSPNGLK